MENISSEKSQSFYNQVGELLLDFLETLIIATAIFVVVYNFLMQPHSVIGASMEPNFYDGDYILTDKITYRLQQPQRGDVVVFRYPNDLSVDYIKRVIGLPGENVLIENGAVTIFNTDNPDGLKLKEPYLPSDTYTSGGPYFPEGKKTLVPLNSYFVLGDNRTRSSDSRFWGTMPKDDVVGKAWFRYWPFVRAGFMGTYHYLTGS